MRRVKRPDPAKLSWDPSDLPKGSRIVVAVSGGADSLTLLHLLSAARTEHCWDLITVHVHHGMRGESADEDVRFLEETCRAWDVPLEVSRVDVPAIAEEHGISVEEAGRLARYKELGRVAYQRECNLITTAHTADDQAETVLMRLFRGAGLDGLAGIPRKRPLHRESVKIHVVRPLLNVWRRDIEAYCAHHGLRPRFDETNLDLRYQRSRIRQELIPQLEQYDPHVRAHLVRIAAQAASERELLTREAEALVEEAIVAEDATAYSLRLNAEVLAAAEPALTRRALRLVLKRLQMVDIEGEASVIDRLLKLVQGDLCVEFYLPRSLWSVSREAGEIRFRRPREVYERMPQYMLHRCGDGPDAESHARLTVTESDPPSDPKQPPHRVYVDAEAVYPLLWLRFPEPGDRFQPLGSPGSRLLSDVFIDKKIKRFNRPLWPLVVDSSGIVWVVGVAVAERCRVTDSTKRCLLLEVDPLPPIRS
jgi:tRNA(Ile)-lysidine synthase